MSFKRLQTMQKKLRGNSTPDLRKVGQSAPGVRETPGESNLRCAGFPTVNAQYAREGDLARSGFPDATGVPPRSAPTVSAFE
jgi:hypothetical protein